jgi:hypothetical protein
MKKYKAYLNSLNNFVSISLGRDFLGSNYLLTTLERLCELNINVSNLESENFIYLTKKQLNTLIKD